MEANRAYLELQRRKKIRIDIEARTSHLALRGSLEGDEDETFKCSEMVCDIAASPRARRRENGMNGYNRSDDTILRTASKIMEEPYPCAECTEISRCQTECNRFKRYCSSKGDKTKWQI